MLADRTAFSGQLKSFLLMAAACVLAVTVALSGSALAGDTSPKQEAPVITRTSQGGEMVKVPSHMHHRLTATVDARGKLKYECKQGHTTSDGPAGSE